jgi:hypothetical protein
MKKSSQVTLTLVAALGMAACSRGGPDPCENRTFNEQACLQAVKSGGYYWNGKWVPVTYYFPYSHYYDSHQSSVESGGQGGSAASGVAGHPGDPAVTRGGFGETGASHGAGE